MDARHLLSAAADEIVRPPRLSAKVFLAWFFLFPLVEGLSAPLESTRMIAGLFVCLALLRFFDVLRAVFGVLRKSADAPRAVRLQVEQRVRRLAVACRNGALAVVLSIVSPSLARMWAILEIAGGLLEAAASHSKAARRLADGLGVAVPAAGVSEPEAASPRSTSSTREKPAKHRTNRYEVIDEGLHSGRIARGSLRQEIGA
jgi:hypothetical protein